MSEESDLVVFAPVDLAEIEELEEQFRRSQPSTMFKLGVGVHVLRILPPLVGQRLPWVQVHEHFVTLPDNSRTSYVCPRVATSGQRTDPYCREALKLSRSPNPLDQDKAKKMFGKPRFYANALYVSGPSANPGEVKVLPFTQGVQIDLKKLLMDSANGWGDFSDPQNGYNIKITRVGTDEFTTRYTVVPLPKRSPIAQTPLLVQQIAAQMQDLSKRARVLSDTQIADKLAGRRSRPEFGSLQDGAQPPRTAEDDLLNE